VVLLLLSVLSLAGTAGTARADEALVVIIHPANPHRIDRAYLIAVYTGRTKGWPDGSPVFPLDQLEGSDLREAFYRQYIGRSVANMRALWAQNIFSGKGLPPKVASPDGEMKRIVATNRNAIGYIRASEVDDSVRVLLH
jgi:ABC-type phosphate transport system substrate-binding protein